MKKQGYLERRILVFFFIAAFTLVFILTLFSWQIIQFSIRQNEDRDIKQVFFQISSQLNRYTEIRREGLKEIIDSNQFIEAVATHDVHKINDFSRAYGYEDIFRRTYIYDAEQNLIWGDRYPLVDEHIARILEIDIFRRQIYYPIIIGRSVYFLFWDRIVTQEDSGAGLLGYICYLEQVDFSKFFASADVIPIIATDVDMFVYADMPALQKEMLSAAEQNLSQKIIRLGIESAGGLLIYYDTFSNPAIYVFFSYERSVNQFAYRGLFAFLMILSGLALLIISLAGTWFKGKIIAPVRDVSLKMKEIESNPASIEPMGKRYSGILGDMIDTFNSMNNALVQHSNSLAVYKTISDNLDSGILWMDSDLNILLCNPSTAVIFDVDSCDEVIGKNLKDFINLDAKDTSKARTHGLLKPRFELHTGSSQKFIRLVIFSIRNVDNSSGLRHIAGLYDITKETKEADARQKMELELIKSNRMAELGRLSEGIVHNINSPLNTIVGYAQLHKKDCKDNPDIDKILAASNNIAIMVKKLLAKVREDSISMIRPLDINELLALELDMCKHNLFFSQNVTLRKELQPGIRNVYAAHGDISICVANIINNAIQAMKNSAERVLTIKSEEADNFVIITISDTGTGISPENLNLIFEPEFSTKESSDGSGFGLGLAISKSIIEKYKGTISVESELGTGSIFTIKLPVV